MFLAVIISVSVALLIVDFVVIFCDVCQNLNAIFSVLTLFVRVVNLYYFNLSHINCGKCFHVVVAIH